MFSTTVREEALVQMKEAMFREEGSSVAEEEAAMLVAAEEEVVLSVVERVGVVRVGLVAARTI